MTLLTVVKDVCEAVGVPEPTSIFSNITGNRTMREMLALSNEMAQRIAYDTREWQLLKKVAKFPGDATATNPGTTAFDLPQNFKRMLLTADVWRLSTPMQPMRFFPDMNEWLNRRARGYSDARGEWTIYGGQMHIWPPMPLNDFATFAYLDKNCVSLAAGGVGDTFVADGDRFSLGDRLLKLGMIWQWKAQKGSPYTEDLSTYGDALLMVMGADSPAPIIVGRTPISNWANVATALFGVVGPGAGGGPVIPPVIPPVVEPPIIHLSGTAALEGSSPGTIIGNLSVTGGSGTYTFSKAADPSTRFAVIGNTLTTVGVWDYEVATSYSVTVAASNGVDAPTTQAFTINVVDVLPPSLSNPIDNTTGPTTGDLSVTTNVGNGTLYVVVTNSITPPSVTQVKAGQDNTGAAAVFAANATVTSTGVKTFSAFGLVAATAYFTYFMHEGLPSEQSLVTAANGFLTNPAPDITPPVLSAPIGTATGGTTATIGVSSNEASGVLYYVVTKTGPPTPAQIKLGQDEFNAPADKSGSQPVTTIGAVPSITLTGLASQTGYFAYFMQEDAALNQSNVAATTQFTTADITAPTLSAPTGVSTSSVTATIGVTTNEANGILYWVVTTSATTPTKAQIKAGQNNAGTAANAAGNRAVSTTGVLPGVAVTGLVASTAYFAHFMQEDTALNQSNAVSSTSFTTAAAADTTAPVLSAPTASATGPTTASIGVTTNEANGILYWVITGSATQPTKAQIKLGQNNTGTAAIKAGNQAVATTGALGPISVTALPSPATDFVHFMQEDAALNQSNVVSSASFALIAPAPVLTAGSATATGPATATLGVTTDTVNGTLYVVLTTSATAPTAAQIKAGQTNTGVAAPYASNQAITTAGAKTFSATGLSAATAYFTYFMHENTTPTQSAVLSVASFTTSVLPAPVLTAPTGTQTGSSTATLGVTTNTANGTLYTVLTTSATPPTAAQVKAGQTNTGVAAPYASSQAVTTTGAKTFSATGLTPSTAYFAYFMHENTTPTQSLVAAAASFTTAAPPAPILTAPAGTTGSPTTATLSVSTNTANGTLYTVLTLSATPPSAAQVKLGQTNTGVAAPYAANQAVTTTGSKSFSATGLVSGTTYFAYFMHESAAAVQSLVAAAASFATSGVAPAAPTLVWATTATDNKPDFDVGLVLTPVDGSETHAGDILHLQRQPAGGAWTSPIDYVSYTLLTADLAGGTISVTGVTAVPDGNYAFRARLERGAGNSAWTADVAVTIDVTAPTLSSPTGTQTGPTTATLGVSSNEASGIVYWVLTGSATAPSKAQVKAGQNNTGAAALKSGNQAVTATGAQSVSVTGLSSATTYFAYFMQEDTTLNQSNVAAASSFTTSVASAIAENLNARSQASKPGAVNPEDLSARALTDKAP